MWTAQMKPCLSPHLSTAFVAPIPNLVHKRQPIRQTTRVGVGRIGDELTDFITAGRKMRRWYGQEERDTTKENEPEEGPDDEEEDEFDGEYVLVSESDSSTAELIIMQLILNREKVKVLCDDAQAVTNSFGPYVKPIVGDVNNVAALVDAVRGVKCMICVGQVGEIVKVAQKKQVPNVILLSSANINQSQGFDFRNLFGESAVLRDPKREAEIQELQVPSIILRCGQLTDDPGAKSDLALTPPEGLQGSLSREDLGWVVAQLVAVPNKAKGVIEVVSSGPGSRPDDFESKAASLLAVNATSDA